jgi:cytochrome bd-type quinol oxidase subunit 2
LLRLYYSPLVFPPCYANETWLVVAGASLFGVFFLAYGIALNALYTPVAIMVFGLVFRAVSLEFGTLSWKRNAFSRSEAQSP